MRISTGVAVYFGAGLATLVNNVRRAGKELYVWPGFGTTPPGPVLGALETIVAWPFALYEQSTQDHKNASSSPSPSSTDAG